MPVLFLPVCDSQWALSEESQEAREPWRSLALGHSMLGHIGSSQHLLASAEPCRAPALETPVRP